MAIRCKYNFLASYSTRDWQVVLSLTRLSFPLVRFLPCRSFSSQCALQTSEGKLVSNRIKQTVYLPTLQTRAILLCPTLMNFSFLLDAQTEKIGRNSTTSKSRNTFNSPTDITGELYSRSDAIQKSPIQNTFLFSCSWIWYFQKSAKVFSENNHFHASILADFPTSSCDTFARTHARTHKHTQKVYKIPEICLIDVTQRLWLLVAEIAFKLSINSPYI